MKCIDRSSVYCNTTAFLKSALYTVLQQSNADSVTIKNISYYYMKANSSLTPRKNKFRMSALFICAQVNGEVRSVPE